MIDRKLLAPMKVKLENIINSSQKGRQPYSGHTKY